MKKFLSILISVALLMSLMVSVSATETEDPTLTVDSVTAEVGDTITLNATMSGASYATYGLQIVYDETALELVSVEEGEPKMNMFLANNGTVTGMNFMSDTFFEGTIFTMTFNVLAEGEHTVDLDIQYFTTYQSVDLSVTAVAGVVTVGDVTGGETEGGEGEIVVETTDTYGYFDLYSMTAPATGTYTFYIPAGLGVITEEAYNNWGDPIIGFYDNEEGYEYVTELTEGDVFSFYVGAITKGEWTITYTYTTSTEGGEGGEGGEGAIPEGAVDLTIGNNQIDCADITFVYTAPTDGTLILNLSNAIMGPVEGVVTVNFENAQNLYTTGQITLELVAGDVVLVAFTASGYATMTAEWETEGGEGGETPEPTEPDGTQSNPFIIETLPYEGTQDYEADLYYQWTATENGTLYVYTEGSCSMEGSSISGWETMEGGKYIEVAAGDVIIINVWFATSFTVEFVPAGAEHEHNYVITDSKDATCTEDGYVTYTCECGDTYTETITATGHSHEAVVTEPTCTEDGYTTYTCHCGDTYTADVVPATGHNYVDGVCANCGEADPDYVPECEHEFVDGVCTKCGEADPDYVDPNPGTGSLNVAAIALITVMSLTAVVVTAKKSDEE